MTIAETWGTTHEERRAAYPCYAVLDRTDVTLYRGISIDAPAPNIFRWLCQLRIAPYSYDWIDNRGRGSPQQLTPGLEELAIGQGVMTIFDLVSFEPGAQITVRMRPGRPRALFGDVVVTYMLRPVNERSTRLVAKLCIRAPRPPLGWLVRYLFPWGDLIMMRKQFHNLKRLAEVQGARR